MSPLTVSMFVVAIPGTGLVLDRLWEVYRHWRAQRWIDKWQGRNQQR